MTLALADRARGAAKPEPTSDGRGPDDQALDALLRQLATNRFMPVPPAGLHEVGDGDFRAIGAEFLGHFVRQGGLQPNESVLDIGCGLGRMALPLTQYLRNPGARYQGLDVVPAAIAWCRQAITAVYPEFRFDLLDVRSELYNPGGAMTAERISLPVAPASVDFVIMTSVVTHLHAAEVSAYLRESARALKPGGRCLVSLFLMDDTARAALKAKPGRLRFDPAAAGPEFAADAEHPLAAVAFERDFFVRAAAAAGLAPARPVQPGTWSGRPGLTYQDLCVLGLSEAKP